MTPGFSRYLDLLRVIAALTVLASHLAYARFTRGDYLVIREWNLGSDAVILFFVLSGYVIAYAAREKDKTLGRFAFARASRLYSVVLPAILLTLVFDHLGSRIAPAVYDGWWWNPAPMGDVLLRTMTFSTEWAASGFRPGTNGPFWSLSYEAAYYMLFGIGFFLNGWRRLLLLALFLPLAGIKVLLLMPAWLGGVWLFARADVVSLRPIPALVAFVAPILLYAGALAIELPDWLMVLTSAVIGQQAVQALRFSDEFLWNALLGALVTAHLMAARALFERSSFQIDLARLVTWLAGASFSIYLVHYPALQFWHAVLPVGLVPLLRDALLLAVTLTTCLLFAAVSERRLPEMRRAMTTLWQAMAAHRRAGHGAGAE
ncbi:MAG: acyltransferase [Alphaproteobacteria bacterium]